MGIPTGRAVDVIRRIGLGLNDSSAGRTFSITGPPQAESRPSHCSLTHCSRLAPQASLVPCNYSPTWIKRLPRRRGLDVVDAKQGFSQALVTATREPVASTLERAIKELRAHDKRESKPTTPYRP